jgi:maleylacetoacetate isomerase
MKLYSYFRSSASYRVRIALNLKGLSYETIPVHLLRNGGEQLTEEYRRLNPDGLVPVLADDSTQEPVTLTQSVAIIEYLDEKYPDPALLPANLADRAYVRSLALTIACEIHPLNNLRVLRYLVKQLGASEEQKNAWYRHWCEQGLAAVEAMLSRDARTGKFCYGNAPTLADCLLVPQVASAQRLNSDLSAMPTVRRINAACLELDAFIQASPAKQPDAE